MWSHLQRYIHLHSFHNSNCCTDYEELPYLVDGLLALGCEYDLHDVPLLLAIDLDLHDNMDVAHCLFCLAQEHGDQEQDQNAVLLPDYL